MSKIRLFQDHFSQSATIDILNLLLISLNDSLPKLLHGRSNKIRMIHAIKSRLNNDNFTQRVSKYAQSVKEYKNIVIRSNLKSNKLYMESFIEPLYTIIKLHEQIYKTY